MTKILLAEDDALLRAMVVKLLRRANYEVVAVEDGQAAVNAFLAEPDSFQLILLDVQMPRLDGIRAWHEISARRLIPTLFWTADLEKHREHLPVGKSIACVQKPLTSAQVLTELQRLLQVSAE